MTDPAEIKRLLDQGLTRYGLGQVEEAMHAWHEVLRLDPENGRAKEYIRFVEENWSPGQRNGIRAKQNAIYRPDEGSNPFGTFPTAVDVEVDVEELSGPNQAEPEKVGFGLDDIEIDAHFSSADPNDKSMDVSALLPVTKSVVIPAIDLAEPETSSGPSEPPPIERSQPSIKEERFVPPAKSVLASEKWGDLYDFGQRQEDFSSTEKVPAPSLNLENDARLDVLVEPAPPSEEASVEVDLGDELIPDPEIETSIEEVENRIVSSTLPPHPESGAVSSDDLGEALPFVNTLKPKPLSSSSSFAPDNPVLSRKEASAQTIQQPAPAPKVQAPPPVKAISWGAPPPMVPVQSAPVASGSWPPIPSALDLVAGLVSAPAADPPASPQASPVAAADPLDTLIKGASDLLKLDDFTGALELLEKILAQDADNADGLRMRADAERGLGRIYSSKLGDILRVPRVRMSGEEIIWLSLDHKAGFVLSLVDGQMTFDEILSVCGLATLEAMRILVNLIQDKVIE